MRGTFKFSILPKGVSRDLVLKPFPTSFVSSQKISLSARANVSRKFFTCIIQFRNLKFEKEVRGMSWRKQFFTWFSKTAVKICSSSSPPSPYLEQNPGLKARIHKCNSREKDCLLPQKKLKRRLKNAQLQCRRWLRPLS